jgi:hypothetical protein
VLLLPSAPAAFTLLTVIFKYPVKRSGSSSTARRRPTDSADIMSALMTSPANHIARRQSAGTRPSGRECCRIGPRLQGDGVSPTTLSASLRIARRPAAAGGGGGAPADNEARRRS